MIEPTDLRVADVMSTPVVTVERNDKLAIGDGLMKQQRIRHLPVLDEDGRLCGIVSQRDLFRGALLRALGFGSRAEQHLLDSDVIKQAMHSRVLTTTPETPLREAAALMLEHKVGCLPVLDGDRLAGILTEADFVRQFAGR